MRLISPVFTVVCLLFGWSLVSVQMTNFADDPGVGWHLASGEYTWNNFGPPATDPFLALPNGVEEERSWVSDQWLSDILVYAAYSAGGWPLLYALGAALFLSAFMLVAAGSAIRSGVAPLAVYLSAAICGKAAQIHFILRPVLIGIFIFALVVAVLHRELSGRGGKANLVLLVALFAAWANLHPSFVIGLGFVSIVYACQTVASIGQAGCGAILLRRGASLIAMVLATLINPYGIELHQSILQLASSSYFMHLHTEWLPIDLSSPEGTLFLVLLVGNVGLLVAALSGRREQLPALLGALVIGALTFKAIRFLPFFAVVAVTPFAVAVQQLARAVSLTKIPALRLSATLIRRVNSTELLGRANWLVVIAISTYWVSSAALSGAFLPFNGTFGPSQQEYPLAAISALKGSALGRPLVVFAPSDWGGAITWFGDGKLRAIIDDRNTLLGESLYRDVFAVSGKNSSDADKLRELFASFNVDYALVPKSWGSAPLWSGLGQPDREYENCLVFAAKGSEESGL